MRNTLILAAIAGLAFTTVADAKSCTDPTTHKFVKCPAAAATTPTSTTSGRKHDPITAPATGPHCTKGKACGNTCIKMTDVCHK